MRSSVSALLLGLLSALLLCSSFSVALLPPPDDADPSTPAADPSIVFVQLQFVEISKIDGVEQAFRADFYMLTTWAADNVGLNRTVDSELLKEDIPKLYWMPMLEFMNARDEVTRLVEEPFGHVDEADLPFRPADFGYTAPPGSIWITEDQRYQCDFTTPLNMQAFPYDSQYMMLAIESFWDTTQVKIRFALPGAIEKLLPDTMPQIIGWIPQGNSYYDSEINYAYNERVYHRLTIRTMLQRQPQYYLSKIITGALLLVYMCVWVFSLAIDEADRMMGTLQVFAGLVTFLFVASGDVPKVPYETRLDLFFMWSFFMVATMLAIHGALYYWRECDLDDEDRERIEAEKTKKKKEKELADAAKAASTSASISPDSFGVKVQPVSPPEIELSSPSLASGSASGGAVKVYVNDPSAPSTQENAGAEKAGTGEGEGEAGEEAESRVWRLRVHPWKEFSLTKWYRGLHFTRQWDAICVPALAIAYSIGVAVIFGRPVEQPK